MKLDYECRDCLFNSQMKKVEKSCPDANKLQIFRNEARRLCDNPPEGYCAPLLARDINRLHKRVFGEYMDYSREKSMFNLKLLETESELYSVICAGDEPLKEALKYAMAANYIDFARLCDLDADAVDYVISAARKTEVDERVLKLFKTDLAAARSLCYLHDNCGEIVLDKILIRVIQREFPDLKITSIVRGMPVINDVTEYDAKQVGLDKIAKVVGNGSDVAGTYINEISREAKDIIFSSDVVVSKGLGNLETLYGEVKAYYCFCCKCGHISKNFGAPLWSSVFIKG